MFEKHKIISKPTLEKLGAGVEEANIRERILKEVPSSIEGMHTARIDTFFKAENLEVRPYHVIREAQIPLLREITGQDDLFVKGLDNGWSSPRLGMVFVLRDEKSEALNGIEYTEGLLVHELAHSSTAWAVHVTDDQGDRLVRSGFSHFKNLSTDKNMRRGQYLEEGFAQSLCAKYIYHNMGELARAKFAELYKCNPSEAPAIVVSVSMGSGGSLTTTPANMYFDAKDMPNLAVAGFAAAGLVDLYAAIDGLKECMKESRRNSESLREIPRLINSIDPGLYSFLSELQYTTNDFVRGTHRIQELVGTAPKRQAGLQNP